MRTEELDFHIPTEQIAQHPAAKRSQSKLLVLNRKTNELTDTKFNEIGSFLRPGDLLVINDTKVLPARFFGHKLTGAKIEGLFLHCDKTGNWTVLLKGSRKLKENDSLLLTDIHGKNAYTIKLTQKLGQGKWIVAPDSKKNHLELLEQIGFPPLPPYIKRQADATQAQKDKDRYQTVYAQTEGAVAAPTAGLHFTDVLMDELKQQGVRFANVTLHVGYGTFKPVTAENVEDHEIHREEFSVSEETAVAVRKAKEENRRVIAVGTTSVRSLESASASGSLQSMQGTTNLFITPGYEFKTVDAMITNFHLPRSTLLALVAAFAGLEPILDAYNHAVGEKYRFFSYGDAMLMI